MTLSFSTHIKGKPTHFVGKIWDSLYKSGFGDHQYSKYNLAHMEKFGSQMDELMPPFHERTAKIHTIRADKSNRWKPGNKIHFVINNRTPDRFQFAPIIKCESIQSIKIKNMFDDRHSVEIGGIKLQDTEIETLALNDGFESVDDFWAYFFMEDFEGKIIHWTDYRY